MNLRHLEVFHAVITTGSVTKAARLLGVTQPAVSNLLAQCEGQLGIKLFERIGGRLHPTSEATAILPNVTDIFDRLKTVNRITSDLSQGWQGKISVAATFSIANGILARAVADLLAVQPDMEISIYSLPTSQIVEQVVHRVIDFGLGIGPVANPEVTTQVLARCEARCFVLADHPLTARDEIEIQDVAEYRIICPAPHTASGKQIDALLRSARIHPKRCLYANSSETAAIMASKGAGVAVLGPYRDWSSFGALVSRPLKPAIALEAIVIEAVGRPRTKASQLLLEAVRKETDNYYTAL